MIPVPKVDGVDAVFGNIKHMPKYEDIPEEFKKYPGGKWNKIMSTWFYSGLGKDTKFIPKEGVDVNAALGALKAILVSFEPKHEHKEAAVAYLMSEWFEDIVVAPAEKAT